MDGLKKPLEAWTYIKKAHSLSKNDKAIFELYEKVKVVKEEHTQKLLGNKQNENGKDGNEDHDSSDDETTKNKKSGFKFSDDKKSNDSDISTTADIDSPGYNMTYESAVGLLLSAQRPSYGSGCPSKVTLKISSRIPSRGVYHFRK